MSPTSDHIEPPGGAARMPEAPQAAQLREEEAAAHSPVLVFRNVSKAFADGTRAFDGISFELRPGELVSIVGPSGCGKTTVLKVASGLLAATSGVVDRAEGSLGYVFQDPTLLPWRTVSRNVELLLELQ